ncbi:hypothetical protein AOQ84DRAFT_226870 [Glonium stellatum]|uniref:Uncharacterized protein n=1 Tax=Glonium stellatum TaxID=574774 RepID=A0A8E2ERY4_9PEZI|nr:hypothetical protein AOQ84DRAFT_226870 [Glonium stellatum]
MQLLRRQRGRVAVLQRLQWHVPRRLRSLGAYPYAQWTIPFSKFASCTGTLSGVNCSSQYGFPKLPDSFWKSATQPNGTATVFSNLGGSITSPLFGSTTVWYFEGPSGTPATATAAAYNPTRGSDSDSGAVAGISATGTAAGAATGTAEAATGSSTSKGKSNSASATLLDRKMVMQTLAFQVLGLILMR